MHCSNDDCHIDTFNLMLVVYESYHVDSWCIKFKQLHPIP